MIQLLKANCKRLFQHIYFLIGCVIATVVTALFAIFGNDYTIFQMDTSNEAMIFISAAILVFFATFSPLFVHVEFSDGVIRNKLIAGHTQKDVYLAQLLTQFIASLVMFACWILGGLIGGARLNGELVSFIVIMLLNVWAFISLLTLCSMLIKKKVVLAIGVFFFYIYVNAFLIGNAIVSFSNGIVHKVATIIYHMIPTGQWFSYTSYCDPAFRLGVMGEITISALVIIVFFLLGTLRINKREIA